MVTAVASRPGEIARACPPIESGMRMEGEEFERLYDLHPEIARAELIDGVVYVTAAMRHDQHGVPNSILSTWAGVYAAARPTMVDFSGVGSTVRIDRANTVQPDVLLRYREGRSILSSDGYLSGAPDLIAEVAASSLAIDLGAKFELYRRSGVREHLVWRVYENELDWFSLEDGTYVPLSPDERGIVHSKVFPGLRLAVGKLLARDLAGVLAELTRKPRAKRA